MLILPKDIKNVKYCLLCKKQRLNKDISKGICVLCKYVYSQTPKLYYYRLSPPL
jgi:hypothetical protein